MNLLLAGTLGAALGAACVRHTWKSAEALIRTRQPSFRWGMVVRLSVVAFTLLMLGRIDRSSIVAAVIGLVASRNLLVWRVGRVRHA